MHFYVEAVCMIHTFTFLSNFILSAQADFTLGTKEYWVSLKYLFNRSGHTLRIFTTRSATISSSVAVFKPSRKRRRTIFPPLLKKKKEDLRKKKSLLQYFTCNFNSAAPHECCNAKSYTSSDTGENPRQDT